MPTIGVLMRIDERQRDSVWRELSLLRGALPFALDNDSQLGLVLETEDVESAYRLVSDDIVKVKGVLSAYPVYAHYG
ncbi:MAG: hypothetical protein HZC38_13355 [Chloroflexi bacterium]|nr:hypothetical protein [Chloroflexota bacterium]